MRLIYLNHQKVREIQLKKKLRESHEYYLLSQFLNKELRSSKFKKHKNSVGSSIVCPFQHCAQTSPLGERGVSEGTILSQTQS